MSERLPPHDVEAEKSTLGSILIAPHKLDSVTAILQPDDFFMPAHRNIYSAMLNLAKDGSPVDYITLSYEMRARGELKSLPEGDGYFMALWRSIPTAEACEHYARIVKRTSVMRRLIIQCAETQARAYVLENLDEVLADHRNAVSLLDTDVDDEPERVGDVMERVLTAVEDKEKSPQKHYVQTGHAGFDRLVGGHGASKLIVVASLPGYGKSSWGVNCAVRSATNHGTPNLIFSMEMDTQEVIERMLGFTASVECRRLHRGSLLGFEEWKLVYAASKTLTPAPLYVYDKATDIDKIAAVARRFAAKHPGVIGQIVIDYLQILKRQVSRGRTEESVIADITRGSKLLAKALHWPVVLISQLTRDITKDRKGSGAMRRPRMSDMKGSGAVEADADMVVFTWPDQEAKPTDLRIPAELIVEKHRGGPTGSVRAVYDRTLMGFYDRPPTGHGGDDGHWSSDDDRR